jgi:hypothetical protein
MPVLSLIILIICVFGLLRALVVYKRHGVQAPVFLKIGTFFLAVLFIYQLISVIRYFVA